MVQRKESAFSKNAYATKSDLAALRKDLKKDWRKDIREYARPIFEELKYGQITLTKRMDVLDERMHHHGLLLEDIHSQIKTALEYSEIMDRTEGKVEDHGNRIVQLENKVEAITVRIKES